MRISWTKISASIIESDAEPIRKGDNVVQSSSSSVDEFLTGVQPERLEALTRLRALCVDQFCGWDERMQWGMPGYGPAGQDNLISFNNQKGYIALYAGRAALDPHRATLKNASFGGGCVRFAKPERIDWPTVETILKDAFRAKANIAI